MTNDRVALDKDWHIFTEPYLEGFQLTISRGHYDEEVILSADEAKALRDWLCARYPVEPAAPLQISGAPFPVYDLHGKPRAPRRCPDCGVIEGDLHEDDCPIGGGAPCTFAENREAPRNE